MGKGGLVLASFDNNRYSSVVLTIDSESGAVLAERALTGRINAVAWRDGGVWTVDGDFGLRRFDAQLNNEILQPLPE